MKRLNTKRIALAGLFLALALIVSLIESYLPPIIPVLPYAKIGLGNVVLLACFLCLGVWEGYIVLVLRCVLTAVFAGNYVALMWSLPSAFVAYTAMVLLYKTRHFSVVGTSMVGGILHNFVQICVACAVIGKSVFAYLPYMMLAGALAGFATGTICYFVCKTLKTVGKDKTAAYDQIEYCRENGEADNFAADKDAKDESDDCDDDK